MGLTHAEEREVVRASLQRQVEAREQRLSAPYRLAGDLDDPARQLDLRLARIAAREFKQAQLGATGRELYAGLRVGVETLRDPLARAGLVSVYALLEVDGFVVEIDGCEEEVELSAELVLGLEQQSGRPVDHALPIDWTQDAVRRAQMRVLRRAASA